MPLEAQERELRQTKSDVKKIGERSQDATPTAKYPRTGVRLVERLQLLPRRHELQTNDNFR